MYFIFSNLKILENSTIWVKSKLVGENDLQATETEIVRAAVKIDKGIEP